MAQKQCKSCGAFTSAANKFCPECGTRFDESMVTVPKNDAVPKNDGIPKPPIMPMMPAPTGGVTVVPGANGSPLHLGTRTPDDPTLTMLAEYCRKTVATVGGDGYTEWVLHRRADGGLQIDYYRNYVGYEKEIHTVKEVTDDVWDNILKVKKKYRLTDPPSERSMGMCGGEVIVKICDGDEVIRLVRGGLNEKENEAFGLIAGILSES